MFSIAGSAASGIAVAEPNHPDEFQIRNRGNRVNEFLELLSRISNRSPPGGASSNNEENNENNPGNDSSDNNSRQDNQAAQRNAAATAQNSNANNDSSDNSDDEQEQNQGRFFFELQLEETHIMCMSLNPLEILIKLCYHNT